MEDSQCLASAGSSGAVVVVCRVEVWEMDSGGSSDIVVVKGKCDQDLDWEL